MDSRCGDASPRTWSRVSTIKQYFKGAVETDVVERSDSARQTSEDEGTQADSTSEDAKSLTMHDSTSSLKEGLHAKSRADLLGSRIAAKKET